MRLRSRSRGSDCRGCRKQREWDALPVAPKELARLFPGLWPTKKAAERWNEKNPPEAHRDIIRVWGVFVDYKSKRQRRWSRALVRHGAVPRTAIAAVLGVAAGNIQVRKTAASEPFVNASTVPTVHPTTDPSPSLNTVPAARPSNGSLGFPKGYN
jgi:hypothetical protein